MSKSLNQAATLQTVADATSKLDTQKLPLRRFHAMLANRNAAPCRIIAGPGDSITEGAYAVTVVNRWQNLLMKRLRQTFAVTTGNDFPFIPVFPGITTPTDFPVTRTGTVVGSGSYGLGLRAGYVNDATGKITFTFTGTRAKVAYVKGVAGTLAIMKVIVDGGAPVTLDTSPTGSASTIGGQLFDLGALTAGTHTVEVSWDAASGAGKRVYVEGLFTFNGDENAGIRVFDAGHSGFTTTSFTAPSADHARAVMANGPVGLAIIALGVNDIAGTITAATFKTNLQTIVTAMRTQAFSGSILYLMMAKPGDKTDAEWNPYVTAVNELAAADPDAVVLDLSDRMPKPVFNSPQPSDLGLYQDFRHLTPAGDGYVADVIAGFILPR